MLGHRAYCRTVLLHNLRGGVDPCRATYHFGRESKFCSDPIAHSPDSLKLC